MSNSNPFPQKWHRGHGKKAIYPETMDTPDPSHGTWPLQPRIMALAVGGLVFLLAVLLVAYVAPNGAQSATATQAVMAPTPMVTSTPRCTSAMVEEQLVNKYMEQTQWSLAVAAARATLRQPDLCQADRKVLFEQLIKAGQEEIFDAQFGSLDVPAQQAQVTNYFSLRREAADAGVSFPMTELQVAERANKSGQYLLAKSAFDEAYTNGRFTTADRALLQEYSKVLYDLGISWTNSYGDLARYHEGLRMLVASYLVDKGYQLGSSDAWRKLGELVGTDEQQWPPTADTPLLPMLPAGKP